MIDQVDKLSSTYLAAPQRFEAGTPNVAGAVALKEAIEFVEEIGLEKINQHEIDLTNYCQERLGDIPGLQIVGQSTSKVNVFSFNIEGVHHSDLSQILDQQAIAVRAGHHCNQLIMKKFGIAGTVRASFSVYNSKTDVDALYEGIRKAREMLL